MSSEYLDTNNSNETADMGESDSHELSDFHKSKDSSYSHKSSSFSAFNSSSLSGNSPLDKPAYDSVHENVDPNASSDLHHLFEVGEESNNFVSFHDYSINKDVYEESDSDSHSATENRPTLVHGFSFGNISIPFERKDDFNECEEEDDNEEDEGIGGIYGTDEGLLELKTENRSIGKPSPVENRRHVISKQIGRIGHIGQNIGLGHQIGVLAEDSELRPKPVGLEKRKYILDEESPLQTNICWSKPGNADNFKNLTYEIEMKSSNSDQWAPVVSVKFPVFRVYHTEDKLFIGKTHFLRQSHDVSYTLRVRSHGEATLPSSFIQDLKSDWSKEIIITFLGYETSNVVEQTSL